MNVIAITASNFTYNDMQGMLVGVNEIVRIEDEIFNKTFGVRFDGKCLMSYLLW